jgi:hypothetical protein
MVDNPFLANVNWPIVLLSMTSSCNVSETSTGIVLWRWRSPCLWFLSTLYR